MTDIGVSSQRCTFPLRSVVAGSLQIQTELLHQVMSVTQGELP